MSHSKRRLGKRRSGVLGHDSECVCWSGLQENSHKREGVELGSCPALIPRSCVARQKHQLWGQARWNVQSKLAAFGVAASWLLPTRPPEASMLRAKQEDIVGPLNAVGKGAVDGPVTTPQDCWKSPAEKELAVARGALEGIGMDGPRALRAKPSQHRLYRQTRVWPGERSPLGQLIAAGTRRCPPEQMCMERDSPHFSLPPGSLALCRLAPRAPKHFRKFHVAGSGQNVVLGTLLWSPCSV